MSRPDDEFRRFVESRAAALHRSAYLLCGDWHLAHDLVQEALAKAYRHWGRVARADSPEAYVRRIVVNEANRNRRRHRHGAPVADARYDRPAPGSVAPDLSDEVVRRAGILQATRPGPWQCVPRGRRSSPPVLLHRALSGDARALRAKFQQPSQGSGTYSVRPPALAKYRQIWGIW